MRYAISGDIHISNILAYDVVIIGAGIAGLYAALNTDERLSCLILAKDNVDMSNSWLAQGGIAAAVSGDDKPFFHLEDTVAAGAGLCDLEAVSVLVGEGPSDIDNLISLNVPFDYDEYGELHITIEGGHHMRRVVHAGGDATGRKTVMALSQIVSQRKNIVFSGHSCLFEILTNNDNSIAGVVIRSDNSEFHFIKTCNVIIATGGAGQIYRSTTNPLVATGDGIAAAMRAGAELNNIEFVQFHPTGLWNSAGKGREFLISEALRGEGALLVNGRGERFMLDRHPLAELAPRDVVAREITKELRRSGDDYVFLDITSKPEAFLRQRFPTIFDECLSQGINIASDLIPVRPVQHYLMGGIKTDLYGRTNVCGLFACGEAASTGVHGANRLASNSILECLVFGRRTAQSINARFEADDCLISGCKPPQNGQTGIHDGDAFISGILSAIPIKTRRKLDYALLRSTVQQLMDDFCGVIRNKAGLHLALDQVSEILAELEPFFDESNDYLETLSVGTVARAILEAALLRPLSVGSHYMLESL